MDEDEKTAAQIYKDAVREAISDWLNERYISVGKWTVRGLLFLALSIIFHAILVAHPLDIRQIILETASRG